MHPVILQVGPVVVGAYALMLTLAFLFGTILAVIRAKKYDIPHYEVINLVIIILIASIVGARLLFILQHKKVFLNDPMRMLYMWNGGLSYYGGLLFAIIGFIWWNIRKNINIARMLDIFTPSFALGFFFVRIGCFLNGCCFGMPTDVRWGVVFPLDSAAGRIHADIPLHPTQLYASVAGLISFFLLLGAEEKFRLNNKGGLLFFLFLMFSTLWRFIIENYRYQSSDLISLNWITEAQVYSMGIFIISIIMVNLIYKNKISF